MVSMYQVPRNQQNCRICGRRTDELVSCGSCGCPLSLEDYGPAWKIIAVLAVFGLVFFFLMGR